MPQFLQTAKTYQDYLKNRLYLEIKVIILEDGILISILDDSRANVEIGEADCKVCLQFERREKIEIKDVNHLEEEWAKYHQELVGF